MGKKLSEKDYIHEGYKKDPWVIWIFGLAFVTVIVVFGALRWYEEELIDRPYREQSFLQVTNREVSLFLWQHPEYMRSHRRSKSAYLPGFESQGLSTIKEGQENNYVVLPPEVLHEYHLWKRLLGAVVFERSVTREEFQLFLETVPEWHPERWNEAPESYTVGGENLPDEVMQAFVGWKNYTKEGEVINVLQPTVGEMRDFLKTHPEYASNLWQNIYSDYLEGLEDGSLASDDFVPDEQLPGFLRVAFYNHLMFGR